MTTNLDLIEFARHAPDTTRLDTKVGRIMDHFEAGFAEWMEMSKEPLELAENNPRATVSVNAELFAHTHHLVSALLVLRYRARKRREEERETEAQKVEGSEASTDEG